MIYLYTDNSIQPIQEIFTIKKHFNTYILFGFINGNEIEIARCQSEYRLKTLLSIIADAIDNTDINKRLVLDIPELIKNIKNIKDISI